VRGLANAETMRGFAANLQAAQVTYHRRDGDRDFVVFCFAAVEDAQAVWRGTAAGARRAATAAVVSARAQLLTARRYWARDI
jgi:hypothetical protein